MEDVVKFDTPLPPAQPHICSARDLVGAQQAVL